MNINEYNRMMLDDVMEEEDDQYDRAEEADDDNVSNRAVLRAGDRLALDPRVPNAGPRFQNYRVNERNIERFIAARRQRQAERARVAQNVVRNIGARVAQRVDDMQNSWLKFCLFPDLCEPQRMPSMFPVPTHIIRRQRVTTLSLSTPSAGSTIYGLYRPETWPVGLTQGMSMANTNAVLGFPYDGIRSDFVWRMSAPGVDLRDNTYIVNASGNYDLYGHLTAPSVTGVASGYGATAGTFAPTNVGNGGVRLIGSFLEIEYVGTVEQHSGMIEVGLRMHNAQHLNELAIPMFMDDSEIVQAPFYKKFKPSDGARVVWFPVDNGDFQFTNYATDWRANQVLEVSNGVSPTTITDSNPFSTAIDLNDVSNAFGPLQKRVYPQWAVNISGLQVGQSIRISIVSYYETVPDDSYRDLFLPRKTTEFIDPSKAKSAVTAMVQQGVFATPAKTSSVWSSIRDGLLGVAKFMANAYQYVGPVAKISSGVHNRNVGEVFDGVMGIYSTATKGDDGNDGSGANAMYKELIV